MAHKWYVWRPITITPGNTIWEWKKIIGIEKKHTFARLFKILTQTLTWVNYKHNWIPRQTSHLSLYGWFFLGTLKAILKNNKVFKGGLLGQELDFFFKKKSVSLYNYKIFSPHKNHLSVFLFQQFFHFCCCGQEASALEKGLSSGCTSRGLPCWLLLASMRVTNALKDCPQTTTWPALTSVIS